LIFISYFFYPNKEVGANRIRFWVTYILKYHPEIEPVVITATKFSAEEQIAQFQYYVEPDASNPINWLIKDQGLNWSRPLVNFFNENHFENLAGIVMTGGPFMQFSSISQIKKNCKCKVLIDFRDPFSDNQRFSNSFVKKMIKRSYEKQFVKNADFVVSVNSDVLDTLAGYKEDSSKFIVIPNGYDDISIDEARRSVHSIDNKGLNLIVAGKYYLRGDPSEAIHATMELSDEGLEVNYSHYGGMEAGVKEVPEHPSIIEHGITDYVEIAKALVAADIGLLITQGVEQNTPTKLFDYMGAELPILIITDGEFYKGNTHHVTSDYPYVRWCKNIKTDIKKAISEMSRSDLSVEYPERKKFSRREGLNTLLRTFKL